MCIYVDECGCGWMDGWSEISDAESFFGALLLLDNRLR